MSSGSDFQWSEWWWEHQFDDAALDGWPEQLPRRRYPAGYEQQVQHHISGGASFIRERPPAWFRWGDEFLPIEVLEKMGRA